MKKMFIPVLALLGMVACTNENEPEIEISNNEPVEIKLDAQLSEVAVSRAAIAQGTDGALTADLENVQFLKVDGATAVWTGSLTPTTATIKTDGNIDFGGNAPHYPINGDKTHIMGYYPAAAGVTDGAINMTITGQEDVIYASAVEGSKNTEITAPLAFSHKLTQFKFIIKRDADIVDVANVSVKVKGANTVFKMDIADGTLSEWGTSKEITALTGGTAKETASAASNPIMLQPDLASLTLAVTGDSGFSGEVTVNSKEVGGKYLAGKAYTITLRLGAKDVAGSASIGKWEDGTNPDEEPVQ